MPIQTRSRSRYRFTKLVQIMRQEQLTSDFAHRYDGNMLVTEAWADIRPVRATEQENATQMVGVAQYEVAIRQPGVPVLTSDWIAVDDRRLDITAIEAEHGNDKVLLLQCKTRDTEHSGDSLRG